MRSYCTENESNVRGEGRRIEQSEVALGATTADVCVVGEGERAFGIEIVKRWQRMPSGYGKNG